ncbi:prephenate dehydratase [Labrys monachus]|uniref:prephenate dehydratase n=1 Tax=Labrys monachus TaxID=217067 RepID=A0ABU0FCF6_9HYPH|nr:prephenate dehydratase [Labrys monachus]MDQ0392285.1 prephenate dehydratase [Labrys monachus]
MSPPPLKIAFQGEPGANSHIASLNVFPEAEPLPCPTFEDAFNAVSSGQAALAMIPIENSVAGRVADIHHLMPTADLHIVGEYFLPIHHQLMAIPGASLQTIRTVHSHPQALGQCRNTMRRLHLTPVTESDTAGSARLVRDWQDPGRAALAPALAAEIYGLEILAADVEDETHNMTRFIVLSNEPRWPPVGDGPCITSLLFTVRNLPAALYKAMGGFATNGVNMTKLESYMVGGFFFATQFYADVEGHPDEPGLRRAIDELRFFSTEVRIVGVYPANPVRGVRAPPAE